MKKSETWRTVFPEMQDDILSTPRKRPMNISHLESQLTELLTSTPTFIQHTPSKKQTSRNQLSKEHPFSASMYTPTEKPKKPSQVNKVSLDNPLNYKAKPPLKSAKAINTKMTESKIAYLPGSKVQKSPPRIIKTTNSETYFDFLPGSRYAKALPVRKPLTRILNKQTRCTNLDQVKSSCKKQNTDKLANSFNIGTQFE